MTTPVSLFYPRYQLKASCHFFPLLSIHFPLPKAYKYTDIFPIWFLTENKLTRFQRVFCCCIKFLWLQWSFLAQFPSNFLSKNGCQMQTLMVPFPSSPSIEMCLVFVIAMSMLLPLERFPFLRKNRLKSIY